MHYIISYQQPQLHFIDIHCIIKNEPVTELQLPAWRPGRYELGNFAKNVVGFAITDHLGKAIPFSKITKDRWSINVPSTVTEIHVSYKYYAAELNAGSTYVSERQLYVNPVNCLVYIPGMEDSPCTLQLNVPADYTIATGLDQQDTNIFKAHSFHQLADSPLIASNTLQKTSIEVEGIQFSLWFQGTCHPNWKKLNETFLPFIKEQFQMMGGFPFSKYDFLFQIVPHGFYHGVEHLNSTVICLGPGYQLNNPHLYNELLGVSCHELFHAWNIKSIRPIEMMPYDYTKENYSRLGYVCEGVTTFYGDYLLLRSGVFDPSTYFETFSSRLNKHFHNPARRTMPVTEASFDTWLDGYVPGVPGRKTSIYDEGCLIAFFTDIIIRRNTGFNKSLDDVMRFLYDEYAKKNKGYSESDYIAAVENIAGLSLTTFFQNYVYGTNDFETILMECLDEIGLMLVKTPSVKFSEAFLGFKAQELPNGYKITHVLPHSPGERAGLAPNDELITINNLHVKGELNDALFFAKDSPLQIEVLSQGHLKSLQIQVPPSPTQYFNYSIDFQKHPSQQQMVRWKKWSNT